jgi:hypothetical protein
MKKRYRVTVKAIDSSSSATNRRFRRRRAKDRDKRRAASAWRSSGRPELEQSGAQRRDPCRADRRRRGMTARVGTPKRPARLSRSRELNSTPPSSAAGRSLGRCCVTAHGRARAVERARGTQSDVASVDVRVARSQRWSCQELAIAPSSAEDARPLTDRGYRARGDPRSARLLEVTARSRIRLSSPWTTAELDNAESGPGGSSNLGPSSRDAFRGRGGGAAMGRRP